MSSLRFVVKHTRAVVLTTVSAVICSMAIGCKSDKVIKFGFVAQLTGPDSYVGQAAKLALEDRVKEVNAKGGIDGKKIELITYDSRCEAPEAVAAAKRLGVKVYTVGVGAVAAADLSVGIQAPLMVRKQERVPITGLAGLLWTSTTGAKLTVIPRVRSSREVIRAACAARAGSPAAPRAMLPGKTVTPFVRRLTRPPSWSTATNSGVLARAERKDTRRRTCSGLWILRSGRLSSTS